MNRVSLEAKVGLFFVCVIAIFVYVWFYILDYTVREGFVLKAKFRSVEGLTKDAQVQIAGIRVGKVKDIQFDPEAGKAVVLMLINDAYRNAIPEGSRLFLKTKGLAGDKYLVIQTGKPNARKLRAGEEIDLVFEPTDPEKVLESVGIIAQNLQVVSKEVRRQVIDEKGSDKVERVLTNSDKVFHELRDLLTKNRGKINNTLNNTESAAKNINDVVTRNKDKINRTVDDAEKFSRSLEKTSDKFGKVATDLDSVTRDIRSGKGTLGKLVNEDALYTDAQSLVREVRSLAGNIQHGPGTMGRLINDPEIYYEARRAIRNMNKTAEDVSEATPVSTLAIILGAVFK